MPANSAQPEYKIWKVIRSRNKGPKAVPFHPAWHDYNSFIRDLGPRPTPLHKLARKVDALGYVPGNVRWAEPDKKEPLTARTANAATYTAFGETKTLTEWAKDRRCVPSYHILRYRIHKAGLCMEAALLEPTRKPRSSEITMHMSVEEYEKWNDPDFVLRYLDSGGTIS